MSAGELRKNGHRIRLQEKPLRVLALLAERQGQVVTREELRKHLWPEDTFVDFETGLNTAVSKLRDALSDSAESPRYIETIPRRGYRFIPRVEFVPAAWTGASVTGEAAEALTVTPASSAASEGVAGTKKRAPRPLLILSVVLALFAGALAVWFFQGRSAFSFNSRDSVLITDFDNQTGDPRFDNALGMAFVVSIEQSRYANVFPHTRLDSVLPLMGRPPGQRITASLGREICQRENIRGLLTPSITRTGQEYAISAQLIDPRTGETVRSFTERAHGEDHILEALDVLAKETREALGESLYHIQLANKRLPQVTTTSLTALQQFAEGSLLWNQGKYTEAIALYQAAVASDPNFAMAHAALGNAYYSYITNAPDDGKREYEKALSLASHTTDRERMLIEAHYAADRKHNDEASQLYRGYLDLYPDDVVIRFDFANLLRGSGHLEEALEQYKEVTQRAPDFAHAYIGIASTQRLLGNYSDAIRAYAKAFEIAPGWLTSGNVPREYGFTLVANGEDQKAEQVFTTLLANPVTRENGNRSLAFLDLYHGRYASAQRRLEESLNILRGYNSPLSEGRVHLLLAIVAEGRGNGKEQRKQLDAAQATLGEMQVKVIFGAMLGDAYVQAGVADEAQKILAMIKPLADPHNVEHAGYLDLLQGDVELLQGHGEEALRLLQQSDAENATALSMEALAHAYKQLGNGDKFASSCEAMFRKPEQFLGWEPQQRWLEARYTLALEYSARGDKQKARAMLATLLDLWKDADPDLPLLKQAKAEYAKLQ
jgi:DNA-binding winged helix-turn-helix (wHTH) protein/tetratricopeptide (TPR) repeat protein